jgi:ABC-type transport system involved in multi-copper enzyme maturation permease subunit
MFIRGPHVRMIALHHVKHSLRGGAGLVFVFLAVTIGLYAAYAVFAPLEMGSALGPEGQAIGQQGAVEVGRKALSWVLSMSPEQEHYLMYEKPVIISALLCVLLLTIPFLTCLGAFNQTSGDIGSKGLRYLLQRTERSNIFIGRFIGSYLFILLIMAILYGVLLIYALAKVDIHGKWEMFSWMAGGYLRVTILILPYTALCAWISSAIDSPFGALVMCLLFVILVPIFGMLGKVANPKAGEYIGYVMPAGFKYWLMHPSIGMLLAGVAVMLGFSAIFFFLGLRHFEKRDL